VNAFEIFTSRNVHQNEDRRLNDFEVIWGIWVEEKHDGKHKNTEKHCGNLCGIKGFDWKSRRLGESQKSASPTASSKFQSDIHETKSLIISSL
jgi:hypothetical protein